MKKNVDIVDKNQILWLTIKEDWYVISITLKTVEILEI